MKKYLVPLFLLLTGGYLTAQVSVNQDNSAPDPSAMLDVKSADKGMLIPRMTSAQRDDISNPAPGLLIYNTQDSCFNYFTGTAWVKDCGRSLDADQVPFNNNKAGGPSQDKGYAISTDLDGNVYVTGTFQGTAVFGDTSLVSNGNADVFVIKYNASGQRLWIRSAGGTGLDSGDGISVDAAGNCYVTGRFRSAATFGDTSLVSNGSSDVFVVKYSASGQFLWALSAGGNGIDISAGIGVDASGNIYVTGEFQGAATFSDTSLVATGFPEVFVAKYAPSGQLIWALNAGGAGSGGSPQSLDVDAAGNSYVFGYFLGTVTFGNTTLVSTGGQDIFLAKYNASGQFLWAVKGGGTNVDIGAGVSVDATGNCYVTGRFVDTATFSDTSLVSNGNADIFVVKYDPSGQVLWAQRAGGTQYDDAFGVSTDPAGNAYVTGSFNNTASFGDTSLVSNGNTDIFVTKYAPSGQFLWAKSAGGNGNDEGASIATDASGNAHVTGAFQGTVTFDNTTLTSSGAQDMFVWTINSSGGGINGNTKLSASQDLDPDPTNELQELGLSGTTLGITDGNSVDLAGINTDNQTLNLSGTTLSIANGNSVDISDNDWTLSGNNLYNANSGNVGIGTAAPKKTLHVNGDYYGKGNLELYALEGDGSSGTAYVQAHDDSGLGGTSISLRLRTQQNGNAIDAVHISPNGFVGIGTSTPKRTLHVNGQYYGRGNMWLYADQGEGNSGNAVIQANDESGSSSIGLRLRTQNNGATVETMQLSPSGNVGIGTTTPGHKLSVNGPISGAGLHLPASFDPDPTFVGTPGNYISFAHTGNSEDFIGYKNNTFYFKDTPGGGDSDDPNVVVGGKMGIGTTAFKGALNVDGDYYGTGHMWLHALEGDGNSGTAYVQARDDSGTSSVNLQFRTQHNGSFVDAIHVTSDGKVSVGTTDPGSRRLRVDGDTELDGKVYYTTGLSTGVLFGFDLTCFDVGNGTYEVRRVISSRRFKENIKPFAANAERLLDIRLKSWTGIGDTTGQVSIGYIAEEVDSLGLKDLVLYNEDGVVQSLRFSYFPFYNLEIIKNNRARIVALEDELNAVKQENADMKAQLAELQTAFEQRLQKLEAALQQPNNAAGKGLVPNEK